jgi:muconolactone delta-isomerase
MAPALLTRSSRPKVHVRDGHHDDLELHLHGSALLALVRMSTTPRSSFARSVVPVPLTGAAPTSDWHGREEPGLGPKVGASSREEAIVEYLVDMTTRVPHGVPESEVLAMRAREAASTRELVMAGRVERLWRPPLQPGEWRTLGLFAVPDAAELQHTLRSMPLHVWRSDDVTPLRPHPNDPGADCAELDGRCVEFFTIFDLAVPPGTSAARVSELTEREAGRTRELATQGRLLRLWALPGEGHNLGHWQVRSSRELALLLRSLPLADWLTVTTQRLMRHPNDPTVNHPARSTA